MTSPIEKTRPADPAASRAWCCGTPITGPHSPGCMFEPRDPDGDVSDMMPPAADPTGPAPAASSALQDKPYGFTKSEEFDFWTPGGDKVRLRKLRRTQVLKMKLHEAMDSFTPELLQGINDESTPAVEVEDRTVAALNALADTDVFDRVLVAALVCPQVTLGDPILEEIELEDKIAIFNVVMPDELQAAALEAQQEGLKSVRGQDDGVRGLRDGEAVLPETQ